MPKQKLFELVEDIDLEPPRERRRLVVLVGNVAMPNNIKDRYYRDARTDQLVIPHYAYPFNTVEIDHSGRDILV